MTWSAAARSLSRPRAEVALFALGGLVLAAVVALVLPLPAQVVDLLLSAQLAAAIAFALSCARPLDAATMRHLPALLMGATFFRLALRVATTRLILDTPPAASALDSPRITAWESRTTGQSSRLARVNTAPAGLCLLPYDSRYLTRVSMADRGHERRCHRSMSGEV